MPVSGKGVLRIILCAALILLVNVTPAFGTGKPLPGLHVDPERLETLKGQGYSESEIYSAASLEERTGIPVERWLEGRKQGKSFPELIDELAAGVELRKRRWFDDARDLTEAEFRALMDEGYSTSEISAMADVLVQYGGDPRALLKRHADGESWESIIASEQKRWQELMAAPADGLLIHLGKDGKQEATESGLTVWEITALMKQGFKARDILFADAFAYQWHVDFRKVAAQTRPDQSLLEAIKQAYLVARAANQPKVWTRAGLSAEQVDALFAAGESASEIASADSRAYLLWLDLKAILASKKQGEKLANAVERAHWERPSAERAAVLKNPFRSEESYTEYYAKKTGRSEAEVQRLRAEGKSWIEISGYRPADGQPTIYDLADSWGLTDHALLERALQMGYSGYDARQARRIADSLHMTWVDVLAVKTPQITWEDVIRLLSPLPIEAPGRK